YPVLPARLLEFAMGRRISGVLRDKPRIFHAAGNGGMEYTDVIIRRLRDRLMRYRTENRIGGRKRPWHRVAQDIADAESVPQSFYNREDNFDVLGEALRRFEAGLQVPSKERLDAIRAFLIE